TFTLLGPANAVPFNPGEITARTFFRARIPFSALTNYSDRFPPCQIQGRPDDPQVRNAAIPNASTPIRTIRMMVHLASTENGLTAQEMEEKVSELNDQFRSH